jgi:hypothetical protein
MVQVRYTGIRDPKAAFEALRPYRKAMIQLQMNCRPFSADYMVLLAAQEALDTAAFHFTRDPTFFHLKMEPSKPETRAPEHR